MCVCVCVSSDTKWNIMLEVLLFMDNNTVHLLMCPLSAQTDGLHNLSSLANHSSHICLRWGLQCRVLVVAFHSWKWQWWWFFFVMLASSLTSSLRFDSLVLCNIQKNKKKELKWFPPVIISGAKQTLSEPGAAFPVHQWRFYGGWLRLNVIRRQARSGTGWLGDGGGGCYTL